MGSMMAPAEFKNLNGITHHGESQAILQSFCLFSLRTLIYTLIYSVKVGDLLVCIKVHKCDVPCPGKMILQANCM